jgi:DNA protecting protein DprA
MGSELDQGILPFDSTADPKGHDTTPPFDVTLLALSSIEGLGRKSLVALVEVFGDNLGRVWEESRAKVQATLTDARIPAAEEISRRLATDTSELIASGRGRVRDLATKRIYVIGPSELPPALQAIPDPPSWLFVQGNVQLLYEGPFVAVVGTRKPTDQGREATTILAKQMAAYYSVVLVSGLAEGIDEQAHIASLNSGLANVAFLGHGIDAPLIPARNQKLRARIVEDGGAVVSEYLPDERFQKSYFVQRNRLQAGLADLVIPVEANPKGGTAHTVRFARRYGRRMLGIWWDGANGILEELRRDGYPFVDITDPSGQKRLDETFRALAEAEGSETYALSVAERKLAAEIEARNVRREDVKRLMGFLMRALDSQD